MGAFTGYLGSVDAGKAYDATELIKSYPKENQAPILIDQGAADGFYPNQLPPKNLTAAAKESGYKPIELNLRPGYDHSYYFISLLLPFACHWSSLRLPFCPRGFMFAFVV